MNKLFTFLFLMLSFSLSAQDLNPVKWSFEHESLGNGTYNLIFKADIEDGWYLYSQFNDPSGPVPTSFTFEKLRKTTLEGKVTESSSKVKKGYDEMFEMDITKFAHDAIFKQKVKVDGAGRVAGFLEFMSCNDEMCLPPEIVEFKFTIRPEQKEETETDHLDGRNNVEEKSKVEKTEKKLAKKTETAPEKKNEPNKEEKHHQAQANLNPVKWEATAIKQSDNKALLKLTAKIDQGWGVYAQGELKEGGPVPTNFTFEQFDNAVLADAPLVEESEHVYEGFDPLFGMDIKKFKKEVSFTKEINISKPQGVLKGYLEFMTCDDKQCLPPEFVDFELDLASLQTKIGGELIAENNQKDNQINNPDALTLSTIDLENAVSDCGNLEVEEKLEKKGFWLVFLMGLGGGFLALLTPCVFPMIPLTVSFFTKGSQGKKGLFNAFLYGFFIILVYVLLSVPFHVLEGLSPNILNDISTNVTLNIIFFLIFIFFAFSFFGFYEIELPSSFADKSSKAEGAGGIIGIFFMALTLAIVSFSCTGPILGVLMGSLATSGSAGATNLTAGMLGFGVAFALPFTLFAAFPKLLNSLPSSGGWMNTVKVVLGFIEIALALKFLSNADLVKHWGIIKYEAFLGIWIVVFIAMALYLFGKIKFPHDAPNPKLSKGRIGFGILTLAFVAYLCTGFMYDENTKTYKSLDLLSGFPPPEGYSWLYPIDCPQNFNCFKDYNEALAFAKKVNKPLMIDFTGHACINCRKVEKNVWSQPQVKKLIDENYVLVSLYVDDRKPLPVEEQQTVQYRGKPKVLKTVGDKWAYFEANNFGQVSQPWYVLLSTDEILLTKPIGYSKGDVKTHEEFLKCGLEAFKSLK